MLKSDEFVLVSKKSKNRKRGKICHKVQKETIEDEVTHLTITVDGCIQEIKSSQFYADLVDSLNRSSRLLNSEEGCSNMDSQSDLTCSSDKSTIRNSSTDERLLIDQNVLVSNIAEIVCYGLGNFSTCGIARYQLALLMALREEMQVDLKSCHLYDPRFTETEKKLIEGTGLTLIDKNEADKLIDSESQASLIDDQLTILTECKRCCQETTLFFMPHCDKPLYNNLLYSNWSPRIEQIIIIGNSFNSTIQSLPKRVLDAEAAYILKIVPYTEELPIANTFRFTDIFNDTSIHCFPLRKLKDAPVDFWENPNEPTYDGNIVGVVLNS